MRTQPDRSIEEGAEWRDGPVAALVSGGLESTILLASLARRVPKLVPIFVRFGLVWEVAEERGLRRVLHLIDAPALEPLKVFELPVRPVYGDHWSTTGVDPPDYDSADEAVYLPGRNLLLLAQTALWCHLNGIPTIAIGPLAGNPFADSTADFFCAYEHVFNRGVDGRLRIVRPFERLSKAQVLRSANGAPLHESFSCIRPVGMLHCGRCNKCAERQRGFRQADLIDRTQYATETPDQREAPCSE